MWNTYSYKLEIWNWTLKWGPKVSALGKEHLILIMDQFPS